MKDYLEIVTPVLTAVAGAVSSYFIMRGKVSQVLHRSRVEKKELQREIKDLSAPMVFNLSSINTLKDKADEILRMSNSDMFLILVATNGKSDLRKATVTFEHHQVSEGVINTSVGVSGRYIDFHFDDNYRNMLKHCEHTGPYLLDVDTHEDCDLKRIYELEGVTAAQVFFLRRTKIDEDNDRVWYCSVATHRQGGLTDRDQTVIKSYIGQIQGIIKSLPLAN